MLIKKLFGRVWKVKKHNKGVEPFLPNDIEYTELIGILKERNNEMLERFFDTEDEELTLEISPEGREHLYHSSENWIGKKHED